MTGTIKTLDPAGASGVITAENGQNVAFGQSEVMAYDLPLLVIGQTVSFDLEGGRSPRAMHVCVRRAARVLSVHDKRLELTRLRYMGFDQVGSIRSYRFERVAAGERKSTFTVSSDVALFIKHSVSLQEGPALCLHLLAEELDVVPAGGWAVLRCSLTDREMLAYLASRPAPRAKPGFKRGLPAATSAT